MSEMATAGMRQLREAAQEKYASELAALKDKYAKAGAGRREKAEA